MPVNTFSPACLIDLNGIARAMSADAILALLTGLVGHEVLITERSDDPDRLDEYHGRVQSVEPGTMQGVILQLTTGNVWIVTPDQEHVGEPFITLFT